MEANPTLTTMAGTFLARMRIFGTRERNTRVSAEKPQKQHPGFRVMTHSGKVTCKFCNASADTDTAEERERFFDDHRHK